MKTIRKFELTPNSLQSVAIPFGGKILTIQAKDDNAPIMWVLVDPDMPPKNVHIGIYTTNTALPDDPGRYLGSFTLYEGSLEFHVFEVENMPDDEN